MQCIREMFPARHILISGLHFKPSDRIGLMKSEHFIKSLDLLYWEGFTREVKGFNNENQRTFEGVQ